MYKTFKSKATLIMEEETARWKNSGLMPGDYILIRKDALKNKKLEGRPSQFYDKVKEIMNSDLPLKASAIKSMRPDSQLFMGADAPAEFFVDVVQCLNPGLFVNCMTLPLEVLDKVEPDENNFSPAHPDSWSYKNKEQIHPAEPQVTDKELLKQTDSGNENKNLVTKHKKGEHTKEPKDGRDQVDKPKKYKESVDNSDEGMLAEAYDVVRKS